MKLADDVIRSTTLGRAEHIPTWLARVKIRAKLHHTAPAPGLACRFLAQCFLYLLPLVHNILSQGIDELDELDALRLENDTLRRNLQTLEEKVLCAEEHHAQSQAEKNPPAEFMRGKSDGGQSDPVELRRLNGILRWLHVSTFPDSS